MKDVLKIALGIFLGVLGLCAFAACLVFGLGSAGVAFLTSSTPTPTGPAGVVPARTPSPTSTRLPAQNLGASVQYKDLRVTLDAYEFSGPYRSSSGLKEEPPEGAKFLWLHLIVENTGRNAVDTPLPSDFHVIHEGKQIDADLFYFGRPGYDEFRPGEIFPNVTRSGWLRFTVPALAEADRLKVIFKPFSLFSEIYYTWNLAP